MNCQLDKLCFPPPPAGTPWSGPPLDESAQTIKHRDGKRVEVSVPLFWFNPPWHRVSAETADRIATAVAELGVPVSALRSDLARPGEDPNLHSVSAKEEVGSDDLTSLPRIVPYRPERYGLSDLDFDGASIIDVRLVVRRDPWGRFAYSPEQIERWEATPSSEPLAGGGWVAAATFPPDVVSLEHLSNKLNQLRALSPEAAVFVSISSHRLHQELPAVIANQPDGLIICMDDIGLDGLQLAKLTRHARHLVTAAGFPSLPLWIVPGKISADDAAKLIELGASAIAMDHWGEGVMEAIEAESHQTRRGGLGGYMTYGSVSERVVYDIVASDLEPQVERTRGLLHSMQRLPPEQRLASLSKAWSDALDVPRLDLIDLD